MVVCLGTNAAKYGALSQISGRVEIKWQVVVAEDEALFEFEWRESGGPEVVPPSRRGFGSRLIERVLAADFGGAPQLAFEPEGVVFRLVAPAARLREPTPAFG